jgi:CRP/FNR family transcriptional regulator, anaerobic regulatory protein
LRGHPPETRGSWLVAVFVLLVSLWQIYHLHALKREPMIDDIFTKNGLSNKDLEEFKSALRQCTLRRGDLFIAPGQVSRDMALIEKGYLRTFHTDEKGNEITTEFHKPGAFCGAYYSFYTRQPSFEYIEAITDCELFLMSFSSLQELYAHSFAINVFGRTVLEKACIERDLRLKKIMHLAAREKYTWFLETYNAIYKVAKLGHIASFLGIEPETLSRVRRKIIS